MCFGHNASVFHRIFVRSKSWDIKIKYFQDFYNIYSRTRIFTLFVVFFFFLLKFRNTVNKHLNRTMEETPKRLKRVQISNFAFFFSKNFPRFPFFQYRIIRFCPKFMFSKFLFPSPEFLTFSNFFFNPHRKIEITNLEFFKNYNFSLRNTQCSFPTTPNHHLPAFKKLKTPNVSFSSDVSRWKWYIRRFWKKRRKQLRNGVSVFLSEFFFFLFRFRKKSQKLKN